jgi:ubiquinone/menaquinone biosynthesis C-methylase UbiE
MTEVAEFWDSVSHHYRKKQWEKDAISRFDFRLTRKALVSSLKPSKTDSILEIGCGPGKWSKEIAGRCKRLVAIDVSAKMIENARAYCNRKNASFLHGDFTKSSIKGKFDKIFAVRVIEYSEDKEKFARKAGSLLKDGGILVIITKSKPCLWDLTENVKGFWQEKIHYRKMEKILSENGFHDVSSKPIIIRLPIFKRGNREFPLVGRKNEGRVLRYFEEKSMKASNSKGIKKKAFMLLSESYIISAKKKR